MMKRVLVTCCLLGVLMVGLWAAHAAAPDYSGTWVLDSSKSKGFFDESTLTIRQDDKEITISSDNAYHLGPESHGVARGTDTYKLDGSETSKEMKVSGVSTAQGSAPQVKVTWKAKGLDGDKALELTRSEDYSNGRQIIYTHRLELTAGGKTLKLQTKVGQQKDRAGNDGGSYIYTRK